MRGSAVAAAVALTLCAPGGAGAATVLLEPAGEIDEEPVTRVVVEAAPGEANAVSITVSRVGVDEQGSPTLIVVEDRGAPLNVLRGCERIDAATARCTSRDELGEVTARLGDGADAAEVSSVTAGQFIYSTFLDAGAGDDTLVAGDGGELTGGEGDDVLRGSSQYESMAGGPGNDILAGAGYGDFLDGGPGGDLLLGGTGNDTLVGAGGDEPGSAGVDRLVGERGKDSLDDGDTDTTPAVIDGDVFDGGPGEDEVSAYLNRTAPVLVDLPGGRGGEAGENDVLTDIEEVFGGPEDDTIIGDADDNWLDGRDGVDTVTGGLGDDLLFAGDTDSVDGGGGDDVLRPLEGFAGRLDCGPGSDRLRIDVWPPAPADPRGLFVPSSCERIARGLHLLIAARPVVAGARALAFAAQTFRGQRLIVTWPASPFGRLGATTLRRSLAVVAVPPPVIARIRASGGVLRAVVATRDWSVAWRFYVPRRRP